MSLVTAKFLALRNLLRPAPSRPAGRTLHLFDLLTSVNEAGLPRVPLAELQQRLVRAGHPMPGRVAIHPQFTGFGSGSVAEMAILAALVAQVQPRQLLEFGTCDGASTWHLLANAPNAAIITTLDLPAHTRVEGSSDSGLQGVAARPLLPRNHRIRLIEIDSRQWAPDVQNVDFAFIDAGHTYLCVKNDTAKTLSLMRPGGLVVWHDASWQRDNYGVNKLLRELCAAGRDVALIEASPFDYCALAVLIV